MKNARNFNSFAANPIQENVGMNEDRPQSWFDRIAGTTGQRLLSDSLRHPDDLSYKAICCPN